METIKQNLFTGWHFMRWLRLAFGAFFIVQGIQVQDSLIGIVGGFFLLTALANVGCCGTAGCATPVKRSMEQEREEINFEELNNK